MFSAALKHVMTGQSSLTVPGDPLLASNVLLLKTVGRNNLTNAEFLDSSNYQFSVTRTGDVTQGAFSPYAPTGYWSNYFDGSGDYLSMTNNDQTSFGTGDFTIECWFNTSTGGRAAGGGGTICGKYAGNVGGDWGFELGVSTARDISFYNGNSLVFTSPTNSFAAGVWNHLALVRQSGTMTAYVNGASVHSATVTANLSSTAASAFWIGYGGGGSAIFNGSLSNLRIVKGSAVYTSNFTPPTTPLTAISGTSLLTCQDNRFIDRSSNNFTLTRTGDVSVRRFAPFGLSWDGSLGGSAYFDGSGDALAISSTSALQLNADFTVETWFNAESTGFYLSIFSTVANYYTTNGLRVSTGNSNNTLQVATAGTVLINASTTFANNIWNHLALVRSGTSLTLYLNGTSVGSTTTAINFIADTFSIGTVTAPAEGGYWFRGHLANFRVVKGAAVYTANFTPPTTPLTAITNTSLLLNFDNAAVYDATRASNLSLVGDTKTSTGQVKYATSSVALDGVGDHFATLSGPEFGYGTGNFTVECWVYITGSGFQGIFQNTTDNLNIQRNSSGNLEAWDGSTRSSSAAMPSNSWHHVAISRSGTTARAFLNGTEVLSWTSSVNYASSGFVGGYTGNGSFRLTGNIEDLRISRTARYTAAFTPPARALPVSVVGVSELSAPFSASGGTVTTSGAYTVHTFTSSGTFVVSSGARVVEYLIVAGGGGGGSVSGGGGGAGGVLTGAITQSVGTTSVVVGNGGNGDSSGGGAGGGDGQSSSFGALTAIGGGGGASGYSVFAGTTGRGRDGGSGGGGRGYYGAAGGAGTPGQGNAGGDGQGPAPYRCGGGGGAGGAGSGGPQGGNGGPGVASSISGTSVTYGGGGGGASEGTAFGLGGSGGGGNGAPSGGGPGFSGQANRGGGGGGGQNNGGSGGSGIVIVRYLT